MFRIIKIITLMIFALGCSSAIEKRIQKDPFYETFFLTTRFIMTKFEIQVYKYLPDFESKKEFIKEFWKRRDPTPETEENENKQEFENRIKFANKWFNEGRRARGWDTVRGRILLQLGFPDQRQKEYPMGFDHADRRTRLTKRIPIEFWYYIKYDLGLLFYDKNETGKFELDRPPPSLLSAIDSEIAAFDLVDLNKSKRSLKFKSKFKNNSFFIIIPVKKIFFVNKNEKMNAEFNITILVYHKFNEIDKINKIKKISSNKNDLLKLKDIQILIPYKLQKKGKYFFDIIVEDVYNQSKYRTHLKHSY